MLPRFRTEKECLKLVFAVLWRANERWQRVCFSEHERKQLQRYRERKQVKEGQSDQPIGTAIVAWTRPPFIDKMGFYE